MANSKILVINILQTAFVLLDLCVTVWAPLCYLIGELLGLSILVHANVKPSSLHPLTNVFTAGRLVSLQMDTHTCTVLNQHFFSEHFTLILLTSVNIQEKQDVHPHL